MSQLENLFFFLVGNFSPLRFIDLTNVSYLSLLFKNIIIWFYSLQNLSTNGLKILFLLTLKKVCIFYW